MKLTPDQAWRALESGKRSVNNRREYRHHGGVCYPVAALVWTIATGEWPAKTPRHIDGNPLNNDFANLRSPGRAPYKRKTKDVHTTDTLAPKGVSSIHTPAQQPQGLFA